MTCAATMCMRLVRGPCGSLEGYIPDPPQSWCNAVASPDCMQAAHLVTLVDYLVARLDLDGLRPLTWNGLGFDFRVLAAVLADHPVHVAKVKRLARAQVDPCFNFFMRRGFPVALARVAAAFGSVGKSDCGSNAIDKWLQGTEEDRVGVLRYCEQDVVVLATAVGHILLAGRVCWMTKREPSYRAEWVPHSEKELVAPVCESIKWREPDNKWMRRKKPGVHGQGAAAVRPGTSPHPTGGQT